MNQIQRTVIVVIAMLVLFTGVAAAQSAETGDTNGLLSLIQSLIDFLQSLSEFPELSLIE